MSNKMNNKGFSLIELLAIVVILGIISVIGISATSMLSNKAKKNEMDAHKNVVTMSAQSYLQKNKNLVPKVVGESKNIQISELRESNYYTFKYENGQIVEYDNTLELKRVQIDNLKQHLINTDYQAIKFAEGQISEEDYAPIKAQRQAWRDEINILEQEV